MTTWIVKDKFGDSFKVTADIRVLTGDDVFFVNNDDTEIAVFAEYTNIINESGYELYTDDV